MGERGRYRQTYTESQGDGERDRGRPDKGPRMKQVKLHITKKYVCAYITSIMSTTNIRIVVEGIG